jgi:uncharacterized protein (TIGR02246 family)
MANSRRSLFDSWSSLRQFGKRTRSLDDKPSRTLRRVNNENTLLGALAGLAISFALPTFAQQTVDPKLRERLITRIKAHTDALDKNDAAAVAANFTEDGILVTPDGPFFGREAIQKYFEGVFKQVQLSNNVATPDDNSPHIIGTDGKEIWATGKYSLTVKGQNSGPAENKGYWSVIREGDDWNLRMLCYNESPPPPASPSPPPTPSSQ